MKILRRVLASTIALSLVLLSPGSSAWSQVVQIGGGASSVGGSAAAAGAASRVPGAASFNGAPALSIQSLNSSLSAAPSALIGAPSALTAAPAAALPVPAALNAPAASAARAAAFAPSAAASIPAAPSPANRAAAQAPAVAGPSASALDGIRRELPDFSKMASGESKDAAAGDFLSRVGELFKKQAPALSAVPAAASGVSRSSLRKSSKKGTPDSGEVDGAGNPITREGPLDGLGNPTRTGSEGGPDDRTSPDEGGAGNSQLFGAIGLAGLLGAGVSIVQPLLTLPLVMISLILHEIGHAKVAARLGDPTATLQGRASFNPMKWAGHVDPIMTLALPALTYFTSGFIFGGAKPVPVDSSYFKHPTRDMAKVAFAGPAVNLALAALGALAFTGASAAGMGALVLGALTSFVFINSLLAFFNLIPIPPLDGGHILLALLPHRTADAVRGFYSKIGMLGMLPIIVIAFAGGGAIVTAAAGLTHLLIGLSFTVTGVQLASAALPAVAALGMAIGSLRNPGAIARLTAGAPAPAGPAVPGSAAAAAERPVDLIVVFSGEKALTKDLHLSSVDPRAANYVSAYEGVQRSLLSEMAAVGLTPDTLAAYNATPIASYRRINAATIRLDAAKAAEFSAALAAQGAKVFPNKKIVIPQPVIPEDADPSVRGAVSMSENLQITKADAVQAIAEKRWGKPELNPWQRLKAKLGFEQAPQPLIGVIDSGADVTHPLLKRVKDVKNATSGENVDDIGHGSWVTSMVLNYAPWLKNLTHYKTFLNGSATTDDILKALTMSANDGNLVISNSWGDDEGDPEGPDSLLVKKLASEGHIMVFAAGNAGPGKNTVGAPAIVTYKDPATGAVRVVAVAATDRNKKVVYFSSRGPGSPKTAGKDFPHRPDLSAIGYNTEGAWPAALGDADRTDPVLGPVKAISGTSMSTPSVAGAIALLLLMFGVTEKGAKLDAVVNAVMSTLEKTGKNGVDDEGQGFINVKAAYELLYKQFHPDGVPPTVAAQYRRLSFEILNDERSAVSFRRAAAGAPSGMRDELLEHYENVVEPEAAARRAEFAALLRAYPNAEYASAGLFGRLWLRMTGRGPKASGSNK